jgi:hypothetical protein
MEDTQCHLRFTCFVSGSYLDITCPIDSLLLGSTILNLFQITEAVDDPVTRTAALLSLICALMSLCYGCMYIVKFGMMRNMFHASRWAEVSIYYFASWQHVFHLHPGGAENENLDLVERLGIIGDACHMDVMVGAKKNWFSLFHILNSSQGYGFIFIRYTFVCVADWVGF